MFFNKKDKKRKSNPTYEEQRRAHELKNGPISPINMAALDEAYKRRQNVKKARKPKPALISEEGMNVWRASREADYVRKHGVAAVVRHGDAEKARTQYLSCPPAASAQGGVPGSGTRQKTNARREMPTLVRPPLSVKEEEVGHLLPRLDDACARSTGPLTREVRAESTKASPRSSLWDEIVANDEIAHATGVVERYE